MRCSFPFPSNNETVRPCVEQGTQYVCIRDVLIQQHARKSVLLDSLHVDKWAGSKTYKHLTRQHEMNVYVQQHRNRSSFTGFIVTHLGLTMEVSPADWMNGFGWNEMPRWADASLSWFSCHSPKWAAKSIVTEGRHFTVSLGALLGRKNHQNKVRWSMKFHDIHLLFPCVKNGKKLHYRPSTQSHGGQSQWWNAINSVNNFKPRDDETWCKEKCRVE